MGNVELTARELLLIEMAVENYKPQQSSNEFEAFKKSVLNKLAKVKATA